MTSNSKSRIKLKKGNLKFYEINIEELRLIQSYEFLKSFRIDFERFEDFNFGMFNYRIKKIDRYEIELVDIVFCQFGQKVYRLDGVFYSGFLNSSPAWYYIDGISNEVRKIKFGKTYSQIELRKNVFVFRLKHQIIGGMYDLVSIFEDNKEIFRSNSQFGNDWFLKKHENGFQILSYQTNNVFTYPENSEKFDSEFSALIKQKNKREFTSIDTDSSFDIYYNFFDGDKFLFFFALNESKISKIVEEYSNNFERHVIVNEFINDPSRNIVIKVPKLEIAAIFFFSRIKIKRKLNQIEIFQIDIEEILAVSNKNCEIISNELCQKYNCSRLQLRDLMFNKYGISNILAKNSLFKHRQLRSEYSYLAGRIVFGYFASQFDFQNSNDFYESEKYANLKKEFQKTYNEMSRKVILNPFKNELSLYKLINFYFPDAIYQFKIEWLNGMSLDIFIPSMNLAIEFQGEQHYESVEYFHKDKDSYSNQVSRDIKKQHLCQSKGVKLIEWPYWRQINTTELNKLLSTLNFEVISYVPCTNDNIILF